MFVIQLKNLNLGLCCLFYKEPIKFKTYTYTALQKLTLEEQREMLFLKIRKDLSDFYNLTITYALFYNKLRPLNFTDDFTKKYRRYLNV